MHHPFYMNMKRRQIMRVGGAGAGLRREDEGRGRSHRRRPTINAVMAAIILLVVVVNAPTAAASGATISFNFEVEKRIIDRVSVYMNMAVETNLFLSNYRYSGGFTNYLQASDRDNYCIMAHSMPMSTVYFGKEDGTFIGMFNFGAGKKSYVFYREPGNSGFGVNEASAAEGTYNKHLKSCVNRVNGTLAVCILEVGDEYVKQVSDELRPCADEVSQSDCSTWDDKDKDTCEAAKKYCTQYTIERVTKDDHPLGYVPATFMCHDIRGLPTQEVGAVVMEYIPSTHDLAAVVGPNASTSMVHTLGSCRYNQDDDDDGPLVHRNMTGDYAYCGGVRVDTGGGEVCNSTFVGGYESNNYDPRYRPWYIESKRLQRPSWTDPYPFFSKLGLGITATHPIYDVRAGRNVFAGVVAVDYKFDDIREFLVQSYGNGGNDASQTIVAIYEDSDPNFIIALSTGTSGQEYVLSADPSQPCPDTSGTATTLPCDPRRIPLANLTGTPDDAIIVKAFEHHKEGGYPQELIKIKQSEGSAADSMFYLTQSSLYEQPGANLRWRIIVASQSERSASDTIELGDPLFGAIIAIGSLGFLICAAFAMVFYRKRTERAIIYADWRFTCAFILGCALFNCSTFTLLGPNTDPLCMLRMWSFHGLFVVALSPLFVKVWRIWRLVGHSNRFQRTQISNFQTALWMLPMILGQMLILTVISLVDPPRVIDETEISEGVITQSIVCGHNTKALFIVEVIYEAGLVFIGCILAYQTRNLDRRFGESKPLIFAMYNIALVGVVFLILLSVTDIDPNGSHLIQGIGVWWATVFSSAAFVIPRVITVRRSFSFRNTFNTTRLSSQFQTNVGDTQNGGPPEESVTNPRDENDESN